jgi:hypothetical protein
MALSPPSDGPRQSPMVHRPCPRPRARKLGAFAACHLILWLTACYQGARTAAPDKALELYRTSMPAELPPLGTDRLTLDEAIARATAASAKLAAVRARAAKAEAHVGDAARVHNPELRVSGVRVDELARDEPKANVRLRFRPPRPVENGARTAEAEAEARAAESAIASEEGRIETRIIELFARIELVGAEIAARGRMASLEQDLAARLASRVAQSEATALDQALAELKAEDTDGDSMDARGERIRLLGELGDDIGAAVPASTKLEGGPHLTVDPVELPPERELVEHCKIPPVHSLWGPGPRAVSRLVMINRWPYGGTMVPSGKRSAAHLSLVPLSLNWVTP